MKRSGLAAGIACAAAVSLFAASPAAAQVVRTQPFPGIFHRGDPANSKTQIDFTSFLGAGFETTTISLDEGRRGSVGDDTGFGNLVFRGRLAHQGRRTTYGADAGATTSYYSGGDGMSPFNISGTAHAEGAFGRHDTFALRQSFYYSPYYVLSAVSPAPVDGIETPPDVAEGVVDPRVDLRSARLSTKGYTTFASVGRQVGPKGTVFLSYRLNYIDSAPGLFDLVSQAPRAGYRRRIHRFASFVASYGIQFAEYRGSGYPALGSHDIAVGFGYDRPLSTWRRTTVGFNTSTALIRNGGVLRAHLNGNAHINRRFGRTWIAGATYVRGQQVLEGFASPFFTFSDTGVISASGRLYRELGLSGRASYSHSRYSIGAFENVFDTVSLSSRLQVPIMWALAAYIEAYYADHDFQNRLGLIEGVPTTIERFGTRVGLTVTVPVLR